MPALIVYLLKTIICSGVFLLYYRAALFNRQFHQWNRFYLVGAVLLSILIPLIHIEVATSQPQTNLRVGRLLQIVSSDKNIVQEPAEAAARITAGQIAWSVYILTMAFFLFLLIRGLVRLWVIYRKCPRQVVNGIELSHTHEKDAPFSFFRIIFWNMRINIESSAGKTILQHEMVHVRELHSADRLFMNIVLSFFWFNPFYWLIRREMTQVHEFIADSKGIGDQDAAAFSQMILSASYPGHKFGTTSKFYSSTLKRRLLMLTKIKHPSISYAGRAFFLPVLLLLFAAFTFKARPAVIPEKPVTIVIDAGHGGTDDGAQAPDGTKEKDINLLIAENIRQLNKDKNIRILLTRESDVTDPVKDKVNFAVKQQPDAFVSIHVGSAEKAVSGFDFFVSGRNSSNEALSQLLGSLVSGEISKLYAVTPELKKRTDKGIWVLDAPIVTYPALLVECGNLANPADLAFIKNAANQRKIAESILNAIRLFAVSKERQAVSAAHIKAEAEHAEAFADTLPVLIQSIAVYKASDSVIISFKDKNMEDVTIRGFVNKAPGEARIETLERFGDSTLIMLNDVVLSNLKEVDLSTIKSFQTGQVINNSKYTKALLLHQ